MTDNLLTEEPTNPGYTIDPNKSYYEQMVGENAKFKDNESMAKGKYESDMYVKILERRLDQTTDAWQKDREESGTRAKLQDLLDKLSNTDLNKAITPATSENTPSFDLTQLDSLVSSKLDEREKARRELDNFNRVQKELTEKFGNKLNDHLQTIGLDGKSAAQLAKTNPDLLLKALGTSQQQGFQAPPRNTSGFTPTGAKKETWSTFQEQLKKDPNLMHDRNFNIRMQKAYIADPVAFEDGDFNRFGDGVKTN